MPRSAGILLHVTSLPSRFGIGDFGSQAYAFADFLYCSHPTVWQILPLNSSTSAQGFSLYGSDGTFAGNALLISPEQLAKDGWLAEKDLLRYEVKGNKRPTTKRRKKQRRLCLVLLTQTTCHLPHLRMNVMPFVKLKTTGLPVMLCILF